ncbi:MAG TPA: fibronectin type III domain-containing protein, partial [Flavobacterium sp.]
MKNITFLMLAFFFSVIGYSQSEGFEGTTLPDLATDQWVLGSGTWGVFDNGVGNAQSWTVNSTVATPPLVHSGTRAAFLNLENIGATNTSRDYLATPLFTIPDNGQLRFFTRTTVNGNQGTIYKIMVSTTVQNDPAAYVEIESWTESELTATFNIYEEKVVDLSAYEGDQIYVAFVREFTQPSPALGGDRWLIDDVRFVEKCLAPEELSAGTITQTSALLTWENPSGATQWEIEIIPFAATPTGTGTLITDNPYLATATTTPAAAFQPTTQYKYYVRAICNGTEGNVSSDWVGPFGFATTSPGMSCAAPITIATTPYSTNDSTANYEDNLDDTQPLSCATGGNFLSGNEVFYSYTPTEDGAISISMTPNSSWSSLFVFEGCNNIGVNCIAGVANSNNTVREIPSLNVIAGQQYIIVISSNSNSGPQVFDYTLLVQTLNCPAPTGLTAIATGPNSIVLSWDLGTASSWEYAVTLAGEPVPAGSGVETTVNTGVEVTTLTGTDTPLVVGTAYQYWVRAHCGDGTEGPWDGPEIVYTTTCNTPGCTYTFITRDTFGDSWNGNTMGIVQNGVTVTLTGPDAADDQEPVPVSVPLCNGPFQLVWNAGGNFPGEVEITVVNSFGQIIYFGPADGDSQGSTIFEGIVDCSTPLCLPPTNLTASAVTTNGATLNWTPNGPNPLSWQIYAVPAGSDAPTDATEPTATTTTFPYTIENLLADTTYVYYVRAVCESGGNNPWSAVSIEFTTLPTCPKPTNFSVSDITMTSATFEWTPGAAETAWEVLILTAGSPAPTADSTGWLPATDNTITVNTLTVGTSYDFYVRAVCDPTDSSTWAGPLNFGTTICEPADQCLYSFVMVDSFGDSWNGNTMNVLQNGIVVGV